MITLRAPAPDHLRPMFLSARAREIATALQSAPVSVEAAEWPCTVHAVRLPARWRCPSCGADAEPTHITITEALQGGAVRTCATATYPHRCEGWTLDAVTRTIWETKP